MIDVWTRWASPRPLAFSDGCVVSLLTHGLRRPDPWGTLAIVIADQVSKAMVVANVPLHDSVAVIG